MLRSRARLSRLMLLWQLHNHSIEWVLRDHFGLVAPPRGVFHQPGVTYCDNHGIPDAGSDPHPSRKTEQDLSSRRRMLFTGPADGQPKHDATGCQLRLGYIERRCGRSKVEHVALDLDRFETAETGLFAYSRSTFIGTVMTGPKRWSRGKC